MARASISRSRAVGALGRGRWRDDRIVTTREALATAEQTGFDLVEISPNADPPVCKLLDFGKFKYEQQKKKNEARKKQKIIEVKEIKLRPNIDDHDYDVKMRAATSFLDEAQG